MLPPWCLMSANDHLNGGERWDKQPNRRAKTGPSPSVFRGSVANFAQRMLEGESPLVGGMIMRPERRTVRPQCGPAHCRLSAALFAACASVQYRLRSTAPPRTI